MGGGGVARTRVCGVLGCRRAADRVSPVRCSGRSASPAPGGDPADVVGRSLGLGEERGDVLVRDRGRGADPRDRRRLGRCSGHDGGRIERRKDDRGRCDGSRPRARPPRESCADPDPGHDAAAHGAARSPRGWRATTQADRHRALGTTAPAAVSADGRGGGTPASCARASPARGTAGFRPPAEAAYAVDPAMPAVSGSSTSPSRRETALRFSCDDRAPRTDREMGIDLAVVPAGELEPRPPAQTLERPAAVRVPGDAVQMRGDPGFAQPFVGSSGQLLDRIDAQPEQRRDLCGGHVLDLRVPEHLLPAARQTAERTRGEGSVERGGRRRLAAARGSIRLLDRPRRSCGCW